VLIEIKVPELPESITEATLVNWLKQPGEAVEAGENLIEVETDKVMLEVPAPEGGTLKEIMKGDNESVSGDDVLAIFDTDSKTSHATKPTPSKKVQESVQGDENSPKLSPAVRKMLAEEQLNPADITTAKKGRITKADVVTHLESRSSKVDQPAPQIPPPKAESKPNPIELPTERQEKRVPMTRLRRRVAERLLAAQHENAILTTFNEVNMQPIMELRKRYRDSFEQNHGIRLGFMSFFVMGAVEALKRFPVVNASIDGEDIAYHGYFDIGIAVSSPRGLVVPILRDADRFSMAEIESGIGEFARKAKENELTIEDLTGGTFTITNGGIFGSLLSTPILNPPQSAILGMHKIQERPVVENGQMVIRPMMYLALSYDHRIVDGREAVQFLVAIKERVEDPNRLLLQI